MPSAAYDLAAQRVVIKATTFMQMRRLAIQAAKRLEVGPEGFVEYCHTLAKPRALKLRHHKEE